MGWIITFAILFLIAITPLGVKFRFNSEGTFLAVIAGPFRIGVLPAKKKEKKPQKEKKAKPAPAAQAKKAQPDYQTDPGPKPKDPAQEAAEKAKKKEKGGKITDFLPLVNVVLKFLGGFITGLRFNHLEVKVILAGDDPADLATNYGKSWAALGNLLPRIERVITIKKRDIEIECDFAADETRIIAGFDMTITIGKIFALIGLLIGRAVKELIKILLKRSKRNKRKGGAVK